MRLHLSKREKEKFKGIHWMPLHVQVSAYNSNFPLSIHTCVFLHLCVCRMYV